MTNVPYALKFQIVNGHDALGAPVEAVGGKCALEEYRNHTRLPVVAVNDVGVESDDRHCRQNRLGEENEAFNIPLGGVAVGAVTLEIILVVDEVEVYALIDIFHDTDMDIFHMSAVVHVEMADIVELAAVFPRDTGVVGNDNANVILVVIQTFRQCTYNIGKPAGFDKGDAFGSRK